MNMVIHTEEKTLEKLLFSRVYPHAAGTCLDLSTWPLRTHMDIFYCGAIKKPVNFL